jgi:hypothetical protein
MAIDAAALSDDLGHQAKIFSAIFVQRTRVRTDADVLDLAAKLGLDRGTFASAYNSFTVRTMVHARLRLAGAIPWNSRYSAGVESVCTGGACWEPAVGNSSLMLWRSAPTAVTASSPDISTAPRRRIGDAGAVRYVLVNDAHLKTPACCAQCGMTIGQRYVRQMTGRSVFCDFACYQGGRHQTSNKSQ